MKKILILTLVLMASNLMAQTYFEREAQAVVRTPKFRATIGPVTLTHLLDEVSFDGAYFKIVKNKTDDTVTINDDENLKLKAATTYYHLMKARNYFVDVLKSDYVKGLGKITVRIDMKNQFNELGHFANDNLDPQYNNALTIPAGKGLERRGVKPWGMEIWFAPSKKINISELKVKDAPGGMQALLKQFRNQTHMTTFQKFMGQLINNQFANFDPSFNSIFKMVGTSVIFETIYWVAEPLSKLFSKKWYHLETALVPEIIYHEYSHAALSDKLVLSHSTAVIEGMADYFAGKIANSKQLATHIKKYNAYSGKKSKKKQMYKADFETNEYANSDFVFGLLWQLGVVMGEEQSPFLVYELRNKINTNSSIRGQLVQGLLDVCFDKCQSPTVDRYKLLREFNRKGI